AFFNALADVGLHALELLLTHHRSDGGFWIGRVPRGEGGHRLHDCSFDLVKPGLGYEEPRSGGTSLTTVHEGHDESRRNRLVERGVIEQDRGRFSAKLKGHALHRRGSVAHDAFTNADRACERDLVDIRITNELGAHGRAEAGDDVQDSLRKARFVQCLDQHPCLQRAHLAWLDDDRTACGDGGCQLEANEQRVCIPCRNHTGDANRFHRDRRLAPLACPGYLVQRLFGGGKRVDARFYDQAGELGHTA